MKVIKLDQLLSIAPPADLDVTFQTLPEYSADRPVLCGWKNYGLQFYLECQPIAGSQSHDLFWANKETELKLSTADKKIRILKAGAYQTDVNRQISFRIYQYNKSGSSVTKLFHLISSKHHAFVLKVHVLKELDFQEVNANVMAVLKTARLTAPQPQAIATA
ncbi:hypothetical protein TDB9533_04149 [Thalassocella blandensis]|nr:hypothetical protein TDB9533_04149 [Thalassocella blandensis]